MLCLQPQQDSQSNVKGLWAPLQQRTLHLAPQQPLKEILHQTHFVQSTALAARADETGEPSRHHPHTKKHMGRGAGLGRSRSAPELPAPAE